MSKAALIPVIALAFLTLATGFALGFARFRAARSGAVRVKDIALGGKDLFPEQVRKIGASYENQLEAPTLFYAVVALALPLDMADGVFVALEFAYAILRYVHAYIHMTSNNVLRRFQAFAASTVALSLLWLYFALRALLA
jgi:hypothetical protein